MIEPLAIAYGALVGLSLGLTGSGGSILAIPLLVYGLHVPMAQAVLLSLMMVAAIALTGALRQTAQGATNWRLALAFSASGMIVSPFVLHLAQGVDDKLRLMLFAGLMIIVAAKMAMPRRDATIQKDTTSLSPLKRILPIIGGGVLAGALAGFFGVGGGFIIVPLLTLIFRISYRVAVGTSLASIALIASSAIIGGLTGGATIDWMVFAPFVGGGIGGMVLGSFLTDKMPEVVSRRVFAVLTALMALFMLVEPYLIHNGGTP